MAIISGHLDWRSLKRYSRIKAEDLIEKINDVNVVKMKDVIG